MPFCQQAAKLDHIAFIGIGIEAEHFPVTDQSRVRAADLQRLAQMIEAGAQGMVRLAGAGFAPQQGCQMIARYESARWQPDKIKAPAP